MNSFSLLSIDVINGIKAGRSYVRITIIWHRDFGCNIKVKRYESDRILGVSLTINGSSILFINVYFPVACYEKYEENIMCLDILGSILESYEEDHVCILGDFNVSQENFLRDAQNYSSPALPELADAIK